MEYLSEKYGLVTDNDPVTENGQLFLAELDLLQQTLPEVISPSVLTNAMDKQLENSKVAPGLYNRNPDLTDRRIMSHDNMSGIMSWSFEHKTNHRFEIWSYLLKHLGTYDNSQGKTSQLARFLPFNPGNFFIWGLSAESKIYLPFVIIYFPSLILACRRPVDDVSGKLLAWVEMLPHKNHWLVKHLFSYYEKQMIKMYGTNYIKELMFHYHGGNSHEFPINKILGI